MTVRNIYDINWNLLRQQTKQEWTAIKEKEYEMISKLATAPVQSN